MSEFLAEAKVLVVPDVKGFRTALETQLLAATKGVVIPVAVAPVAAGGVTSLAGATSALAVSQKAVVQSSAAVAGAQAAVASTTQKSTSALLGAGTATARLDAALLGLRTALGSTAVIGLGALALAAIVAGKAISASIKNFAAFQQELSTFRVIAGATADQMKAVSERASALGADVRLPAVSAADAAVAMTELAKAGLTVEEAMAGAEGVLQLATAAQISNADAALIAANALNSFGLAGDQASRVADDLANAANAAQGSISDFGLAFKQSSAVARQVGLSLEDTTAILSLFAKNGLQGSDAGTSLRVALIRLVAPTTKAAAEIKKLGLDIRDAQGNVRADVFAQFGQATQDLSPALRDASAALIFGQDAIRAVSIGSREGAQGLRLMQFEIDQQGTAAEVAAARTEGLAGSFSGLKSNAETLSIEGGKVISLFLKPYVDISSAVLAITNKLVGAFDKLATSALNLETPLGKVKDRMFDILSVGVPLLGEFRLIQAGVDKLGIGSDKNAEKIKDLQDELQALQKARPLAALGGASEAQLNRLTKRINELKKEIKGLKDEGSGISSSVTAPLQKAIDLLEKQPGTSGLVASLKAQIPIAQEAAREDARLARGMGDLKTFSIGAAGGVDVLSAALGRLRTQSAAASDELLRAQNEGATPQTQIAILQGQRQTQEDIIANLKKGGITAGEPTQIRAAREEINRIQAEIDGILAGIKSDAEAAASDAKKKVDDIAQAQEDATKAFIEGFSPKRQKLANALITAGLTERLSDDIKAGKAIVAFLKAIVQAIKDRIKRLHLTGDALKAARAAISAINQEIFNTLNDIAKDQQDAIKRTQEILNQKLDFKIRIAEAQGNVVAEIRAHRAKLAQITKELVKAKQQYGKNSVQWLELKAAQAEEIARIKELEGKTKEKNNAFKELTFQFLQTQQGFAANLLGNLIPGGATGGLVGGPAQGMASAAFTPAAGVQKESAVAAGRDRGIGIQGDTMIHVLRDIKRLLMNLNGRAGHPEARYQKATGGSAMDVM